VLLPVVPWCALVLWFAGPPDGVGLRGGVKAPALAPHVRTRPVALVHDVVLQGSVRQAPHVRTRPVALVHDVVLQGSEQ